MAMQCLLTMGLHFRILHSLLVLDTFVVCACRSFRILPFRPVSRLALLGSPHIKCLDRRSPRKASSIEHGSTSSPYSGVAFWLPLALYARLSHLVFLLCFVSFSFLLPSFPLFPFFVSHVLRFRLRVRLGGGATRRARRGRPARTAVENAAALPLLCEVRG